MFSQCGQAVLIVQSGRTEWFKVIGIYTLMWKGYSCLVSGGVTTLIRVDSGELTLRGGVLIDLALDVFMHDCSQLGVCWKESRLCLPHFTKETDPPLSLLIYFYLTFSFTLLCLSPTLPPNENGRKWLLSSALCVTPSSMEQPTRWLHPTSLLYWAVC